MRVLILGGTGFCGEHLARLCVDGGEEVTVAGRQLRGELAAGVVFRRVDTLDPASIEAVLREVEPERIYHLAGLASVARSFEGEELVYRINVLGTFYVLEGIRKWASGARVLVVGSAEEYGLAESLPVKESARLGPRSPYGVSRVASTLMALKEGLREDGLDVVATRTFNLTGPGQSQTYVCSDFAWQVAKAVVEGKRELVLRAGNIDVRRDFGSVVEGMKAYRALLESGKRGEVYNVCSGRAIAIREIVEMLAEISGVEIRTEVDPRRVRLGEVLEIRGDAGKLREATGFAFCEGSLRQAVIELYEGWVRHLAGNPG